jgi:hypothetical protein
MRIKLINIALCTLVLFATIIWWQNVRIQRVTKENTRLESNQNTLLSDIDRYQTRDGINVASIERLQLTKKELEKNKKELIEIIKGLNIKVKRLVSLTETTTNTEYDVITPVSDTVIILKTDTIELKCIDYKNIWLTLNGCFDDKEFKGEIASRDSIVQVVHRVPKMFWFIKYGTKGIRQEVFSKNPHTTIIYNEYIELTK